MADHSSSHFDSLPTVCLVLAAAGQLVAPDLDRAAEVVLGDGLRVGQAAVASARGAHLGQDVVAAGLRRHTQRDCIPDHTLHNIRASFFYYCFSERFIHDFLGDYLRKNLVGSLQCKITQLYSDEREIKDGV